MTNSTANPANGPTSVYDCVRATGRNQRVLSIVHHQRKPASSGHFSVEGYFDTVRAYLPSTVNVTVRTSPFSSRGLWRRVANACYASYGRAGLHHITGDIHYVTAFLPKRRTILTVLDCAFEEEPRHFRREIRRVLWYTLPVRRAAVITVISEFTRSRLLAHVNCDPDKIRVVPVCVSPLFRRMERAFNRTKPTILQVGTARNKNVERLCAALRGLDCKLHIVGRLSATQTAALVTAGIEYSNSVNLSAVQMREAYERCDIVAFASTYEGFGMPIVEANSVGRPVVTSNVTAMPEIAADAACLVDPFEIGSIRSGIERVISHAAYRQEIVANGFRNAARFAPAEVARLLERVYTEVDAAART